MSRVLLISANITTEPYPVYPIGMSVVAAALDKAGHTVKQFDFLAAGADISKLIHTLHEFAPTMTGISLRNIDNVDSLSSDTNWYLNHVREICRLLKEKGQTVIVGGPGFSLMAEDVLEYLGADHGIIGEGEHKMPRMVTMIESGNAPRLLHPEKGLSDEQMLSPLWDKQIMNFYSEQSGIINIQTKRGCENRCSYCSYPSIEGGYVRPRDAKNVAGEVERLYKDYDAQFIFFTDSVFNDSGEHYLEVAEQLARKALPVKWSAFFQPTQISRENLRLLKQSGLHAMEVGTDASSDTTLQAMKKNFLFEDVKLFNERCVAEQIPCAHFVIFGGPGETLETVQEGITNLNSLEHCIVFPFSGIRLHSGTPLYSQARQEGVISPDTPLLKPFYYFSPNIDPDTMNDALIKGFAGRRDRIFPPADGQERMNVLRRFGYRGLLWDTLISFDDNSSRQPSSKGTAKPC